MHKSLKALRCYAGSTVMGDGKVALILDINGVAEHAKVISLISKVKTMSKKNLLTRPIAN